MIFSDDLRKEMESYLGFLADHELDDLYEAEPLNRTLQESKTQIPRNPAAVVQFPVTPSQGGHTGHALRPQSLANLDVGAALHDAKQRASNVRSLDTLYAELDGFQQMPMRHEGGRQIVRFRGAAQPDLLIVGEIPDVEEDASGQAFAGKPGALINAALKAAGLTDKTMLAPCVFWRTAGGRPLTDEDQALNAPFIHALIRVAAPKAILLLGASAVTSVLNLDQPLSKLRGRIVSYTENGSNIPLVASYSPAFVLRQPPCKALLWRDMLQVIEKSGI
jgi:uracil-DNA glycosylase